MTLYNGPDYLIEAEKDHCLSAPSMKLQNFPSAKKTATSSDGLVNT